MTEARRDSVPSQQPKILIVDDRVENLVALETLLAKLEVKPIRATSGNDALALTLEHDFALLLLDVQMPEMDGFEVVQLLRESPKTEHLPVIFVSAAYSGDLFKVKGVESGAIDFLEKPIIPELLLGKVRLFLELYEYRRSQLQESFRAIVENVSDGVMLVGRDGKILMANRVAEQLLDVKGSRLIGTSFDYPLIAGRLQEISLTETGAHKDVELNVASMPWNGDDVFVVSLRDVTERHRTKQELEKTVRDLHASNAELQSFTYTVSHDLKSPLVTIGGYAGLLQHYLGASMTEDVQLCLREICDATQKMSQLLKHLLDLSRVGRIDNKMTVVACSDLITDAVRYLKASHLPQPLELHVADDLPRVRGDVVRLKQMFQNLLDNAVRYMGDQPQPMIEIGVADTPSGRALFVRDNGMGIPEQYQQKIFNLFERLSAETEGTGVGLALVKKIVNLHDGDVWVESAGKGKGSTFWVKLPFVEEGAEGSSAER